MDRIQIYDDRHRQYTNYNIALKNGFLYKGITLRVRNNLVHFTTMAFAFYGSTNDLQPPRS